MEYSVPINSTSNVFRFLLRRADNGNGITGLTKDSVGLTILVIADNQPISGLQLYGSDYSNIEDIAALGTYQAPSNLCCRFKEVLVGYFAGLYELHLADNLFAISGATNLRIIFSGASNLKDEVYNILLTGEGSSPFLTDEWIEDLNITAAKVLEINSAVLAAVPLSEALDAHGYTSERAENLDNVSAGSGGGTLAARIGESSLVQGKFFDIIQGEEKIITLIVEAYGRFETAVANDIKVTVADPAGNKITILNGDITRVCQENDVQVIRATLPAEETVDLISGLATIEIAFDDQKARLTHAIRVTEQL